MTARAETLERIASLAGEGYKHGFFTDIESEQAPPGLNEDTVRFISAKKTEPQWLLARRVEAPSVPTLAEDGTTPLGEAPHRVHRLSGRDLLLAAEADGHTEVIGRGRCRAVAHLREARH